MHGIVRTWVDRIRTQSTPDLVVARLAEDVVMVRAAVQIVIPGTAIDILTRLARVLAHYRTETRADGEPDMPRVWMSPVTPDELVRDGFDPIARDGAGTFEVQVRLQKTLALLSHSGDDEMARAARAASARALEIGLAAQTLDEHRDKLQDLAKEV